MAVSGDVEVTTGDELVELRGDAYCLEVEGSIRMEGTADLEQIEGFDSVHAIGESLLIRNNEKLKGLETSGQLHVAGDFIVEDNPELAGVGLEQTEPLGGALRIRNNEKLTRASFGELRGVGGELIIEQNDALYGVNLRGLRTVRGDLRVRANPSLADLTLKLLTDVDGNLAVKDNAALGSIELNLPFIDHIGGDLTIVQNDAASHCSVVAAADLLAPDALEGSLTLDERDSGPRCDEAYERSAPFIVTDERDMNILDQVAGDSITGFLYIGGSKLTDLDGFNKLRKVDGTLVIDGTDRLERVSGLSNLEYVWSIQITNNSALETIDGFESVNVDTYGLPWLEIKNNPSLTAVTAFDSLDSIWELRIEHNDALRDLAGFRDVETVNSLHIAHNNALEDLKGLASLKKVDGSCSSWTHPAGWAYIRHNDSLRSLDGLENLKSVGTRLTISSNPSLIDISALGALESTGSCRYGRGGLNLVNNDALTSLEGLNFDRASRLVVTGNDSLADLRGLETLTRSRLLIIADNASLGSLEGLQNVVSAGRDQSTGRDSRDGGVKIIGNPRLTNLDGLRSLGTVSDHRGFVYIEDNPALTDITGLSSLEQAALLRITNNDTLVTLDGLKNLRRVATDERLELSLSIEDNASITSVEALRGLEAAGGLRIIGNSVLASCHIEWLISEIGYENIKSLTVSCNDPRRNCLPNP